MTNKKTTDTIKKIKVTQHGSPIGGSRNQRASLIGLGLRGQRTFMVHEDTSSIRGMIKKVHHLVEVSEV